MPARPRLAAAVAACALLLLGTRAAADPGLPPDDPAETLHLTGGGEVETPSGTRIILPPGYYVPDPEWDRLDIEVHRLQDAETRLTAERDEALRIARDKPRSPTWLYVVVAGLFGVVTGALWQAAR